MDRRHFLASGAFAAMAANCPSIALAQAGGGDARLNALFDAIFAEQVANSPTLASSLGLDTGANAPLKHRLGDYSEADNARSAARARAAAARLRAIDPAGLSDAGRLNRDVVLYQLETRGAAWDRFKIGSAIRPYPIFQQGGAYFSIPDFLAGAHAIATTDDCEAYLDRLAAFAVALDQESAVQKAQAARGFLAPDFSLDLTLGQMAKLRGQPAADSNLVQSLATRAKAKGIAGDWQGRATKIVAGQVYTALDRQIALMTSLRPKASNVAGLWRLPQGDAIYAMALEQATTSTLTPDEVHRMGLAQVAEISAELDTILKGQGLATGTVGERLTALNVRPDQLYANTADGRTALIASLNADVRAMYDRLPPAFATIPSTKLDIQAVPVEIQDGAANGYYRRAPLDGSRPATYFINLKDTGDWPKYSLPSLTFHEGVPGHHLQISIAQETRGVPTIRKVGLFSAYTEGWALYAEEVANELGAYRTPLERAGYLQSFLFRAARLVVDTGIHTKRWTREQATDYLVRTTGFARPRSQREVERYCTQAGQACSYKVGHGAWKRARARAETALGAKFDIKQFHEVLHDGAMPLTILDRVIDQRIAAAKRA